MVNHTQTIRRQIAISWDWHLKVNVASNEIEVCHRIGKKDTRIGSTKTIIRFVNRKYAKQALYNKNKLSKVKKKIHIQP